jgi:hypothetical protein
VRFALHVWPLRGVSEVYVRGELTGKRSEGGGSHSDEAESKV